MVELVTPVRPRQAVGPDYAGQAVLMADGYWYAIPPSSPLEVNLPALFATLAHRPRYGGLVPVIGSLPPGGDWTVGQHTLALVRWGREAGEPEEFLRELFVHDLHEAYTGDILGNVKLAHAPLHAACKELEARCDEQIRLASPRDPSTTRRTGPATGSVSPCTSTRFAIASSCQCAG